MKKLFAILSAVALAFLLAMGDQIYKNWPQGDLFNIPSIRTLFGLRPTPDEPTLSAKPRLPSVTTLKEDDVPLSYEEYMKKGDYFKEKGFFLFAANEFAKASKLAPRSVAPHLSLAQMNFELSDLSKSKADAEHVLTIDPDNHEAKFLISRIAAKQGEFDTALNLIDQLLLNGITDPRLVYTKASILIAQGNHDAALSTIKPLLGLPQIDPTLVSKATRLIDSFKEFEFAQGADDLYLAELLARGLVQNGDYELAVHKLKSILKVRSDLRDAWNLLGFAYLNLQNPLFAASAFEQAYKIDSQLPSTQYFLSLAYSELGRKDDAIAYLNYSLSNGFEPAVVAERKLADLLLDKNDYPKAVEIYEKILKSNKKDIQAYVRPIWIYLEFLNQPDKALRLGESAVIAFPNESMAYNLLGWSQMGTGNTIEAEKNLLKAISMDPDLAAAYYNLGKLYEDQSQSDKAMEQYKKAYELDQNGSIGNLAAKRYNVLMVK